MVAPVAMAGISPWQARWSSISLMYTGARAVAGVAEVAAAHPQAVAEEAAATPQGRATPTAETAETAEPLEHPMEVTVEMAAVAAAVAP